MKDIITKKHNENYSLHLTLLHTKAASTYNNTLLRY